MFGFSNRILWKLLKWNAEFFIHRFVVWAYVGMGIFWIIPSIFVAFSEVINFAVVLLVNSLDLAWNIEWICLISIIFDGLLHFIKKWIGFVWLLSVVEIVNLDNENKIRHHYFNLSMKWIVFWFLYFSLRSTHLHLCILIYYIRLTQSFGYLD